MWPVVEEIKPLFATLENLSNDELRSKTQEFKSKIKDHLKPIDQEIADLTKKSEELSFDDILGKDDLYQQIDKLKKDRDDKIEEVLRQILPEAFAVVKETARRFSTNSEIKATATELDRELSVKKDYIRIDGDQVTYKNEWPAGGNLVTWNMVHYDVQLIGGAVLFCTRAKLQKWLPVKVKLWCLLYLHTSMHSLKKECIL